MVLTTPLPATGQVAGFSTTADGGTVFKHHGEYNRVKTLLDGTIVSTAVLYQDFSENKNDECTFDNAKGLAAIKKKMLLETLRLPPALVSAAYVGFTGDGKYQKHGVPDLMIALMTLSEWGSFKDGDPAHLIERVDGSTHSKCGWYNDMLLGAKELINYFSNSPQRRLNLKQMFFGKGDVPKGTQRMVLNNHPLSETKFLGHLLKSLTPIMRNWNGLALLFQLTMDSWPSTDGKNSKEGRRDERLMHILQASDLNVAMRAVLDLIAPLVIVSLRAQSDLFPYYCLSKCTGEYVQSLRELSTTVSDSLVRLRGAFPKSIDSRWGRRDELTENERDELSENERDDSDDSDELSENEKDMNDEISKFEALPENGAIRKAGKHVIPLNLLISDRSSASQASPLTFPLMNQIVFGDQIMTITNDIEAWRDRSAGGNSKGWDEYGDLFKSNECEYVQLHLQSRRRPCEECGINDGAYGDILKCDYCDAWFHYGKLDGFNANSEACQTRRNRLDYWDNHKFRCDECYRKEDAKLRKKAIKAAKKKHQKAQKKLRKNSKKRKKWNDSMLKKWPKPSIEVCTRIKQTLKLTPMKRIEYIIHVKEQLVVFADAVVDAVEGLLTFPKNVKLMGRVFDWEEHDTVIKDIINKGRTSDNPNLLETLRVSYVRKFKEGACKQLVEQWNIRNAEIWKRDDIPSQKKDVKQTALQYRLLKSRLFQMVQQGDIDDSFKWNSEEWSRKGKAWHLHNEYTYQILNVKELYKDCADLLLIFTRSETMGAAEGKCEGEVSKAKTRLGGRYQLAEDAFGRQHVLSEMIDLFKHRMVPVKNRMQPQMDIIIDGCVEQYMKTKGPPLRKLNRYNSKYEVSATIDKEMANIRLVLSKVNLKDDKELQ